MDADAIAPNSITRRFNAVPMDAPAIVTPAYAITPIRPRILTRFKAIHPAK